MLLCTMFPHPFHMQKMLHRQTSVQPLIAGGQAGGAPQVNPPPVQPIVPVAQPQPGVSGPTSTSKVMVTLRFCAAWETT